ncbi:hypothetical protein KPH14_010396 [Odynerus spinipes]|uniref:Coiled-coil domain-containing protein 134 n=1 Tax=Odynerus spinipes TaxID=1348599 RepID=A0AAD9RTX5_9HYME|nr:hypothetical protein KPH14_010396 [Odynerus spinipes]
MYSNLRFNVPHVLVYIIFALVLLTVAHVEKKTSDSGEEPINNDTRKGAVFKTDSDQKLFKKLFVKRRHQHAEAIERLQKMDNYERLYKMVALLIKKISEVIESNKTLIENLDFTFNNVAFPKNDSVRDALSTILENTAFVGDIVLHFPDIAHRILKTQQEWSKTIHWSLNFANAIKHLLDKPTITVINLVRQELNITKREPGYFNLYQPKFANYKKNNGVTKKKKVKKEKQKKGPQMIKIEL